MPTVEELQIAVDSLTQDEYGRFRRWFFDRDWEKWDREIEEDVKAGRLNFLVQEAADEKKRNKLRDL